jgi:hypothetical protein
MNLQVAYDASGRILAAAWAAAEVGPQEADVPAGQPGMTVTELQVPTSLENTDPSEFIHRLKVDVDRQQLVQMD